MFRLLRTVLAVLGLVLAVAACGAPVPDGPARTAGPTLGVEEFAAVVEEPGVVLIDVRTPAEFAEGHLVGAVNLDVSSPEFAAAVGDLDPAGRYAVYCRSGNRSAQALEIMRSAGIEDAVHLDGGIGAWNASGREIVAGTP